MINNNINNNNNMAQVGIFESSVCKSHSKFWNESKSTSPQLSITEQTLRAEGEVYWKASSNRVMRLSILCESVIEIFDQKGGKIDLTQINM